MVALAFRSLARHSAIAIAAAVMCVSAPAHAAKAKRSEAELCRMGEFVFVGTVVSIEDIRIDPESPMPDHARVLLQTELTVHGPAQPAFSFLVGLWWPYGVRSFSGDDHPAVGQQYAIVAWQPTATQPTPSTDLDRLLWRKLGKDSILPSASLAHAIWREHCAVDFDAAKEGRPTAPFSGLLDGELVRKCEHY